MGGEDIGDDCTVNISLNHIIHRRIFLSSLNMKVNYSMCLYKSGQNIITIDDFRRACAVKGNVQVGGHLKRVDHGDAFNACRYVKKR